jgi:uncharacterized protein (UPF0147 family)
MTREALHKLIDEIPEDKLDLAAQLIQEVVLDANTPKRLRTPAETGGDIIDNDLESNETL